MRDLHLLAPQVDARLGRRERPQQTAPFTNRTLDIVCEPALGRRGLALLAIAIDERVRVVDELWRPIDGHRNREKRREPEAVHAEAADERVRRFAACEREVHVDLWQELIARERKLAIAIHRSGPEALQIEPVPQGGRDRVALVDRLVVRPWDVRLYVEGSGLFASHDEEQLVTGIFHSRFRVEELHFGLRHQLLRPQDVEL